MSIRYARGYDPATHDLRVTPPAARLRPAWLTEVEARRAHNEAGDYEIVPDPRPGGRFPAWIIAVTRVTATLRNVRVMRFYPNGNLATIARFASPSPPLPGRRDIPEDFDRLRAQRGEELLPSLSLLAYADEERRDSRRAALHLDTYVQVDGFHRLDWGDEGKPATRRRTWQAPPVFVAWPDFADVRSALALEDASGAWRIALDGPGQHARRILQYPHFARFASVEAGLNALR